GRPHPYHGQPDRRSIATAATSPRTPRPWQSRTLTLGDRAMKNRTLIMAAIVTALAGSSATFGQGLLDQQLGHAAPAAQPKDAAKPAPAADQPVDKSADTPKPEAKPAKPAGTPGGELISTDAAKKVDDDELLTNSSSLAPSPTPAKSPSASTPWSTAWNRPN